MNGANFLDFVNGDSKLAQIRAAASPFMKRIPPYYTDHSVEGHCQRIITSYLASLLDGIAVRASKSKQLNELEMFILTAAVYLHDIGMISYLSEKGTYASASVRERHQDLSYEIIVKSARREPFDGEELDLGLHTTGVREYAEWIALLAKGHRKTNLYGAEYNGKRKGGVSIRLRELAALLRLADGLDKDYRRIPNVQELNMPWVPPESRVHWFVCHYVDSVNVEQGRISFSFAFPLARAEYGEPVAYLVKEETKDTVAEVQDILWPLVPICVSEKPLSEELSSSKDSMKEDDFIRLCGKFLRRRAAEHLVSKPCSITEVWEEDLPNIAALSYAIWPEAPENESWPVGVRSEYQKFKEGFRVARSSSGEILGYSICFPIKHHYMQKVQAQELSIADMNGNAIDTSGTSGDFWVEAVVRSPEVDPYVGLHLALGVREFLQSQASLRRVGAISMSSEGHKLAALFGLETKWKKLMNGEYYRFCMSEGPKLRRRLKTAII